MYKKLGLLLISAGMFTSLNTATKYAESLAEKDINDLIKSLENSAIEKSPKVALATVGHDKKRELTEEEKKNLNV